MVHSKGEVINKGGFIHNPSFDSKILEVGDEFLETIVEGPIFLLKGLLNKFSEVRVGSGFDVEGIEGGLEVFSEFIEGFLFGVNGGIRHFVIPHFQEVNASVISHSPSQPSLALQPNSSSLDTNSRAFLLKTLLRISGPLLCSSLPLSISLCLYPY